MNSSAFTFVERREFKWNDSVGSALLGACGIIVHLLSFSFPFLFLRQACYVAQLGLELVASCTLWRDRHALPIRMVSEDGRLS